MSPGRSSTRVRSQPTESPTARAAALDPRALAAVIGPARLRQASPLFAARQGAGGVHPGKLAAHGAQNDCPSVQNQ